MLVEFLIPNQRLVIPGVLVTKQVEVLDHFEFSEEINVEFNETWLVTVVLQQHANCLKAWARKRQVVLLEGTEAKRTQGSYIFILAIVMLALLHRSCVWFAVLELRNHWQVRASRRIPHVVDQRVRVHRARLVQVLPVLECEEFREATASFLLPVDAQNFFALVFVFALKRERHE